MTALLLLVNIFLVCFEHCLQLSLRGLGDLVALFMGKEKENEIVHKMISEFISVLIFKVNLDLAITNILFLSDIDPD